MKKQSLLILSSLIFAAVAVNAQGGGGGFQRRTVGERVQMVSQKLDSAFKLDKTKLADADSAFAEYYRGQDKVIEDMRSSGQFDRQAMMEKMQPLMAERDKKLQTILTDDQYKTWKDSIEPSLRPRRQGGGGGGGNN